MREAHLGEVATDLEVGVHALLGPSEHLHHDAVAEPDGAVGLLHRKIAQLGFGGEFNRSDAAGGAELHPALGTGERVAGLERCEQGARQGAEAEGIRQQANTAASPDPGQRELLRQGGGILVLPGHPERQQITPLRTALLNVDLGQQQLLAQEPRDLAEWVLEPFSAEEERRLDERLEAAADAATAGLVDGIAAAMNRVNAAARAEAPSGPAGEGS